MPKGASAATARQRSGAVTFARLTPYLRGIIYGLRMADYGVQDIIKEVEKADGAPLEGNHNRTPSSRDITNVTTSSSFLCLKTHPFSVEGQPICTHPSCPRRTNIEGRRFGHWNMVTLVMSQGVWCVVKPY